MEAHQKPLPTPHIRSAYEQDLAAIAEIHALKDSVAALEVPTEYKVAIVTGATGFLGAAVVRSLLTRTDMRVVCVIRASSVELVHSPLYYISFF